MARKLSWLVVAAAAPALLYALVEFGSDGGHQDLRSGGHPLGGSDASLSIVTPAHAAPPAPPVAEAGFGQTVPVGDTVILDASGSTDPKGSVVTFSWQLTSVPGGSLAVLSDPSAVKPSFVADLAGDYVAELVVSQGSRQSDPDTVTISTGNTAPVADAGDDRKVFVNDTVQLDASRSGDVDGQDLAVTWSLVSAPADSAAALSDPAAVRPDFTVDLAGDYEFELVVDDGLLPSPADRIVVSTANVAPLAGTGPDRRAATGQTIPMDPSFSSDADGDEISLEWNVIARPSASGANIVKPKDDSPRFDVDVAGLYVVQLELTDDPGTVTFDTMIVSTGNVPPHAEAGADQSVLVSEVVQLDGAGSSDVNGDPVTFDWSLIFKPAGSAAAISDPAAVRPTFTADLAGLYVAQLIVSDGAEAGRPDRVVVNTANSTPAASAGPDQTVTSGSLVQLDGTGSDDADQDALTYDWALTLVPKGSPAQISDPGAVSPTFTTNKKGVYVAQLTVGDGTTAGPADGLVIRTTNSRPVADAGPEQAVNRGALVQLDAGGSSDADGEPLTYSWALIVKPAGSAASTSPTTFDGLRTWG